jgi:hypothetical protein
MSKPLYAWAIVLSVLVVYTSGYGALQAMPAHMEVTVTGCQGGLLDGVHVILLGEKESEPLGEGKYDLGDVEIGKHRLYVYTEYGTAYATELDVNETYADIKAEVMLDLCIGTSLTTVRGKVTDGNGKPVKGAEVGVDDLFVSVHTNGQGKYELDLPPGEWEVSARNDKQAGEQKITIPEAEEGGDEKGKMELNLVVK